MRKLAHLVALWAGTGITLPQTAALSPPVASVLVPLIHANRNDTACPLRLPPERIFCAFRALRVPKLKHGEDPGHRR